MTPFEQGQPHWWAQAVTTSLGYQRAQPPLWPDLAQLPPVTLGERRLSDEQVGALLIVLRKSSLASPLPLVREVKRHFDAAALDAFAWRLCELCLARGSAPEVKWGLAAVGLLGGDAAALKLTSVIRELPGQGLHQRAGLALESLRAIGSETALMQLNTLAQRVKFKGLQTKARKLMGEIADERGLSAEQLEDRIVPDLGLDERGQRTFDYGPRQFRLVFGPNLKPLLRDAAGKTTTGLPRAGAADDPAKVAEAARDWKVLKKQVSETVKAQAKRLERALVVRRRWTVADFEKYVVGHPFLGHVAGFLLWGDYGGDGKRVGAFRVTEERTYANAEDRAYSIAGAAVGLVHPLELTDEERARWGEVFGDYELIPPFPQLGRRVHLLQPGEEGLTEITRFAGKGVPEIVFTAILKQQGWLPGWWGGNHGYQKRFPAADVTALLQVGYPPAGGMAVSRALFVPGIPDTGGRLDDTQAKRLGEVDPVTLSEVLGILAVLASKGT
jgi:hypothetical protein